MKVLITGISGTGKTAIGKCLAERGYCVMDVDQEDGVCDWYDRKTDNLVDYEAILDRDFIENHKWICSKEKIRVFLEKSDTAIAVGMPDNMDELVSLFDKIILLQCSPDTFLSRIASRTDNDFGKDPTAKEFLLDRYQKFESQVLGLRAIPVNTEDSLDVVVSKIVGLIQ